MSLPWHTRARVAVIRGISRLLRVPILVEYGYMPEYKLSEVIEYIETCEKLFGPMFDVAKLNDFRVWALQMLTHPKMIDNPFNLHHHPLEFTALFFGMAYNPHNDQSNQEMEELFGRYRETGLKLAWHD